MHVQSNQASLSFPVGIQHFFCCAVARTSAGELRQPSPKVGRVLAASRAQAMADEEQYYAKEEVEEEGDGLEEGLDDGAYPEVEELEEVATEEDNPGGTAIPKTPPGLPPHLRQRQVRCFVEMS